MEKSFHIGQREIENSHRSTENTNSSLVKKETLLRVLQFYVTLLVLNLIF